MSASSSPSKSTTRETSHKRKKSEEVNTQSKRPSIASLLLPVVRFPGNVRVQSREAGDGREPGISSTLQVPSQISPIISESVSMSRGDQDPQNREANGECNLDFPISTKARREAKELQREEASSMSLFQGSSNFSINNSDFNQIHGNATIIRFGNGQFTEDQRNFICDYIANLAILPDINDNMKRSFLTQLIINLPRAEAVFDDYQTKKKSGPCFEGTRVALLREMAGWVTGPDESKMYVLSGLAGIGKSTVAYTIASQTSNLQLLGASFFFSRDDSDRKNAKKFFTTIAYQLCVFNETFAKAIGDVLQTQRGSAAITKSPQEQLQALIVDPLRSIVQSRARPILVVIDALDECDEEDGHSVLIGLKQLVRALPSFKVILTTRPQPYLDRFFGSQDGHKVFRLQDIENKVVDGDIRLYLNHRLSLKQVQKCHPTRQWRASDEEIDSIVRAAGRLFIIASTAVRYILDKVASNPEAQMQKLLRTFAQDCMPFKDLDEFYTVILRNVVPVDCDADIVNRYQSVVSAIMFVQHPLPVTTLVHLVGIDLEEIRGVLVNLQSVILLGDDDIPRIYHKSFPDYITDSKRCRHGNLHIDPTICHMQITLHCFQIMEQYLKYNISGLGNPARFMSNEDGLAKDGITNEQLERNIPQQLRYACVYWANHLEVANIEDPDLGKKLQQFADKHILHWFEALSLIGKLDSAHRAIGVVLKVLKSPSSIFLRQLLLDALRFISKFYATIERSALHTYYSALPFAPTDSLLYCRYINETSHNVCDVDGGPNKWDALVADLSHGNCVDVIKSSFDSTMFASLSSEMLKVWDAVTGTPISTISGGGFAITNDFSTVASFKGNTIALYGVSGSEQGATFTTRANILTLAISSESSRIAAMLSDQTLRLWNIRNRELIFQSRSEDRDWNWDRDRDRDRLQFSATGDRLAYPSASSGFVLLRNGIDGSFIADLDCGSALHNVAFSADGSRFATVSMSGLKLWNFEDGKLVGIAWNTYHSLVAISANGSLLATGYGSDVTLWSGCNGNPLPLVEALHLDSHMWTMTFSLDDTLAIATDDGILLYNVKNGFFVSKFSFTPSTALVFSPDSTRLAAVNINSTIYLWDIRGIEASSPSSNKQARGQVTALALFQDYSRVACGFENGAVELRERDILTKQPIATHARHTEKVTTIGWSPDGRQFASVSDDGVVNLWDGEGGTLRGALQYSAKPLTLEASNTALAVAGINGVVLWDLKTVDHVHTFYGSFEGRLSFSANGVLLAAVHNTAPYKTVIFDVKKCTIISMFDINNRAMAFLPDNSQLVVHNFDDDDFDPDPDFDFDFDYDEDDDVGDLLAFNLFNGELMQGPTFEHFMQLRNMPIWHGIPISIEYEEGGWYLGALFSPHDRRVPVLWIPRELGVVRARAEGRSMIALGCENGHIILLRLHTT